MTTRSDSAMNPVQMLLRFFSSFGLATVVLFLMCVVTLFGTLSQVELGIYEAQKKYFESLFVVHWLGPEPGRGFPLPLPGGLLLMSLLFINLAVGTALKVRKKWKQPGLLIAHLGILFLLLAGFVSFKFSTKGAMVLYEGQVSNLFSSYHDWQIEVAKVVGENEIAEDALVIEKAQLEGIRSDEQRVFTSDELPFDLVINGYARNSMVLPADIPIAQSTGSKVVDGYVIQPSPLDTEAARNIPGAYIAVRPKSGGDETDAILWGFARHPATMTVDGEDWTFQLIKERWKAPFEIQLNKFTHEYYPKTQLPRVYQSDVTKTDGALKEEYEISMNRPLRHDGYTFYQESWGPEGANPGEQVWSQLAVSRNPADQWPMWSCWIVGIGMMIHFVQKLGGYLGRAQRKDKAVSA